MRSILLCSTALIILLSACTPANEAPDAKEPAPEVTAAPDTSATPSTVLSTHYVDAAAALAADNFDKAKASLTALAKESTGELKTLAQTAADTGDIAAMRDAFKAVSNVATTMELPPDHAVAFCPMYKGGAKWVQKKDELANPYYGSASTMASCGNFVN
ncbi:MAG TPA: hypothetical protein VFE29_07485 [Terriglobia bacterium]|nr:hypothetical protein [Terriglobia bacterium]